MGLSNNIYYNRPSEKPDTPPPTLSYTHPPTARLPYTAAPITYKQLGRSPDKY